jgi:DNA-binding XRE family transcriptional regulator
MNMTKETFAKRLQTVRERVGMSQYALAKKAGLSRQYVNQLENTENEPSWTGNMTLEVMEAIALPHKLFAVFTAPEGKLYFRKMWSLRLVGYVAGIGAIKGQGWESYIRTAQIGQVWRVPFDKRFSWMVLVRIAE